MSARRCLAVLLAGTCALAGCEAPAMQEDPPESRIIAPALDLDPTEAIELAVWWTDDRSLLELAGNNEFRLYDGLNRYRPPRQRGQWRRQNYATLWLEAYRTGPVERRRVTIERPDEEPRLLVEDAPGAFRPLPGPPRTIEDELLGAWRAGGDRLVLAPDLRYAHARPAEGAALSVGPAGRWQVDDGALVLRPDLATLETLRLEIVRASGALTLRADGVTLRRAAE